MKSKSVDLGHASDSKPKQNRSFDFVNLYKSASATSDTVNGINNDYHDTETDKATKREKWTNKRKKEKRDSVNISLITNEGLSLNSSTGGNTPLDEFKVTSTPIGAHQPRVTAGKVKSIMKVPAVTDETMDGSHLDISPNKSKKRNKSVSFMLEDNEEMVIKKTKSNNTTSDINTDPNSNKIKRQYKKVKRGKHAEKENNLNENLADTEIYKENNKSKSKVLKTDAAENTPLESVVVSKSEDESKRRKKKEKKIKKAEDNAESKDITAAESFSTCQELPQRAKKSRKNKHQEKSLFEADNEEPVVKSRKQNNNPDVVAELENLSIGDNAHTLTNLLDEMTVVDKENRKKLKQKFNKNKKSKGVTSEDTEKTEVVKEKVKWHRRKWNKDSKGEVDETSLDTTIIVENLPLSLLFSYKKVLAEHFVKYGLIKSVGIAEVYPTEVSKPVFTTTVNFYSDGAATQALEDDSKFESCHIRVKRPQPPTETTVVVRSYGPLTLQFVSSMFNGAGRIRNIRSLIKGKHAMGTFFVEFDGPASVERALKMAANIKVGEKKIYVSKFEIRKKSKPDRSQGNQGSDADQSEGSQG